MPGQGVAQKCWWWLPVWPPSTGIHNFLTSTAIDEEKYILTIVGGNDKGSIGYIPMLRHIPD
jgi:hypothetical protein